MQGVPLMGFKKEHPPRNKKELEKLLQHVTYFESNTSFENNMTEERPVLKTVDSDLDEIMTVNSETEDAVHILSNDALKSITETFVSEMMARYNISPEP